MEDYKKKISPIIIDKQKIITDINRNLEKLEKELKNVEEAIREFEKDDDCVYDRSYHDLFDKKLSLLKHIKNLEYYLKKILSGCGFSELVSAQSYIDLHLNDCNGLFFDWLQSTFDTGVSQSETDKEIQETLDRVFNNPESNSPTIEEIQDTLDRVFNSPESN